MKKIIIGLINWYQSIPFFTHSMCKFQPTCSEYMKIAVSRYGVIKGVGLGIFRILRCNPFSKGGYDPVPMDRKSRICYNGKGDSMKDKLVDTISFIVVVLTLVLAVVFKSSMNIVAIIVGAGSFLYGIMAVIKKENYGFLLTALGLSLVISALVYRFNLLDLAYSIMFMFALCFGLFMIIILFYDIFSKKFILKKYDVKIEAEVSDLIRNPNFKKEYYTVVYSYTYNNNVYTVNHPALVSKNIPSLKDKMNLLISSSDPLDVYFEKPKNRVIKDTIIELFFIIACTAIIISLFI